MQEDNEKIICVDCGDEFEITEGWRKLMAENPNIKEPTRCYQCRQKRKQEKNNEYQYAKRGLYPYR